METQFYLQTSHTCLYFPVRSLTALGWYSFYRPTEGRRLSRPESGWLVTYRNKVSPIRQSNPDTVTHPSINRARRRLTSLIKTNALTLCQTAIHTRILECGPMPNLMVALPNVAGALCSTPLSLADAHY